MAKSSNSKPEKTNKPNHLKDLILLFAVPIGVAIFAAIAVYTPRLLANPTYDFIYSVCNSYSCSNDFEVDSSGHVSRSPDADSLNSNRLSRSAASLRYYSAKDDSTRSMTLEEARQYHLDRSSKSPDGYSLVRENGGGGFLFWSSSSSGWYLKDGFKKQEVELSSIDSYYSNDINFLGWVKQ